MPKLLKYSVIACLVVAICWATAIALWRHQAASPNNLELALWLIALPLALLTGLFLLGRRLNAQKRTKAQAGPDDDGQQAFANKPNFTVQEFVLLAWNSINRLAERADDTLAMLPDAQGLDLDKELVDDEGFPIMAGRIASIDTDYLRAGLARRDPALASQLDDAVLRATAILERTCTPLLLQIHSIAAQAQQEEWTKHLDIVCHTPADWPAEAIAYLNTEITTWAHDAGLPHVQIYPSQRSDQYPLQKRFPLLENRSEPYAELRGLTLILSCASDISRQAINNLAARGLLHSSRNPKGLPPAEGAAAMLVMHAQQADLQTSLQRSEELASSCVRMFLPVPLPSDSTSEPTPIQADSAIPQLLDAFKADTKDVGFLAIHTNQEKQAMNQAFNLLRNTFPDLEVETGLALTGTTLGSLGCTTVWQLAALTAEKTRQSQKPSGFYAVNQPGVNVGVVAPLREDAA